MRNCLRRAKLKRKARDRIPEFASLSSYDLKEIEKNGEFWLKFYKNSQKINYFEDFRNN